MRQLYVLRKLPKLKTCWSYNEICSNVISKRSNFSATNFSAKYVLKYCESGLVSEFLSENNLNRQKMLCLNYFQSKSPDTSADSGRFRKYLINVD